MKNSFTLSFDSWSTDRKFVDTQSEYKVDTGNAQNINSPNYLALTHQMTARIADPNKANNVAVFDNLNVRQCYVDNDRVRYPRDGVSIHYNSNGYIYHYKNLKFF